MHVYKHAQPALLYLGPACLDNTLSSLLLLILFPQEFPSGPRWWGETSSQCSSMRIIPTLRRRRPTKSLPAHYQCLSSSRSLFETKCDNLLSYRDTLLPANLLSSVNIFSPSHAEHIWYFQPSVHWSWLDTVSPYQMIWATFHAIKKVLQWSSFNIYSSLSCTETHDYQGSVHIQKNRVVDLFTQSCKHSQLQAFSILMN